MDRECPNCGFVSYMGGCCSCTYPEIMDARRSKEAERRKELAAIGQPVKVDHLSGMRSREQGGCC